jgi:hypothetical protein
MNTKIKLDTNKIVDFQSEPWVYSVGETIASNTIEVGYGWPETKSHLKIGNLTIHNTHHFNWLERKMWKLLLGFEIEDVEKNK